MFAFSSFSHFKRSPWTRVQTGVGAGRAEEHHAGHPRDGPQQRLGGTHYRGTQECLNFEGEATCRRQLKNTRQNKVPKESGII